MTNTYTPPRRRKSRNLWPLAAVAVALIGGVAIGNAAAAEKPPVEVVKEVPGPTVTKEVEVPGPTVTTNVTPEVCKEALDHADRGFGIARDIMGAILDQDVARMDVLNGQLEALAPVYNGAKAECRAQ